jgi:hypothetical protein
MPPDYLYAGNGIEYDANSSSGLVDNVVISNMFDSGISPQTYANSQTVSGIAMQNSTIDACGFAGVEVSVLSNNGTTGSSLSDISLSGMMITNSGYGWSGRRYGTEGHGIRIVSDNNAGTMSNIRMRTSTVSGSAGDGVHLAGEIGAVMLDRMSIHGNNCGINVSTPAATSLKLVLTASLIYRMQPSGFCIMLLSRPGSICSRTPFMIMRPLILQSLINRDRQRYRIIYSTAAEP